MKRVNESYGGFLMSDTIKLKFFKIEIQRLKKEKELLKIELDVRKREPYWETECITVAKKYGWTSERGFSTKEKAKAWRKEMQGSKPYIEIRGLKESYVITKFGKLIDEDTHEDILDPHNKILHHISSGTFNPVGFCKWDNVKIKHRYNDRCYNKKFS